MDPISAALLAAITNLAEPAVRDAYEALKSLLIRRLGPGSKPVAAVESLEQKPESAGRAQVVEEEIRDSNLLNDAELVQAAAQLLELVKRSGSTRQSVQQTVKGDRNIVSGTGDINITGGVG
jgi:hypothetical protein